MKNRKNYNFEYDYSTEQFIQQLTQNTVEWKDMLSSTKIRCKTKNNKFFLQERKMLQHPLQRVFVCSFYEKNGKLLCNGQFIYPLKMTLLFIVFTIFLIYKNLSAFFNTTEYYDRFWITVFFTIMYIFIAFIFITGKTFFKKQENNILTFLENLQDNATSK